MRLLHSADWHLGRIFQGVHLTDDQAYLLDQFVRMARDTRPDAILIAGDLYDRAVPPPLAVRLLDETLTRLKREVGVPLILIAGNHDSPERIGFGSRLLALAGITVAGYPDPDPSPLTLQDAHGPLDLFALPFAEAATVRERFAEPAVMDQPGALACALDRIRAKCRTGVRRVVICHAFVQGGQSSESERPLCIGQAEAVSTELFHGFEAVALGHLHRCQTMGRVHYSGSLMKYAFDEADIAKSVSLLELDAQGALAIERLPLTPRRDLRRLEGRFDALLAQAATDPAREDYLLAKLTDTTPIFDARARLREVYPNLLHIEWSVVSQALVQAAPEDSPKRTEVDLFAAFVRDLLARDWSDRERDLFLRIANEELRRERETR